MVIRLNYRHFGRHTLLKEGEIEGTFRRYGKVNSNGEYTINESRLLKALPKGFLNSDANKTLVLVNDSEYGCTAVGGLELFRNWSKYFDSYSLELVKKNK